MSIQLSQKVVKWPVLLTALGYTGVNTGDRATAIAGGFEMFMSSLNEFGPDPNLDQRKTVFRYFNLLPYEYSIEDNVKTALMWVRMYFMKKISIKTYSSEDSTLTDFNEECCGSRIIGLHGRKWLDI